MEKPIALLHFNLTRGKFAFFDEPSKQLSFFSLTPKRIITFKTSNVPVANDCESGRNTPNFNGINLEIVNGKVAFMKS